MAVDDNQPAVTTNPAPEPTSTQAVTSAPSSTKQPSKVSITPVRDYWPRYHSRALLYCFLMQLIITATIAGALYASGAVRSPMTITVVVIAILASTTGLNFVLLNMLLMPLRDLAVALTHIADEPTTTPPPNPNAPQYVKSGLNHLLQTIYELASTAPDKESAATNDQVPLLEKGLSETKAGVVILDHERRIVYSNRSAPTRTNEDGEPELELVFDDPNNTLDTWLAECEASAVHADHLWQRLPSKLVGEDDRRIFDVSASYEKGSSAETILIFYDLSEGYQPEDDGLDFIAFAAHELRGPITVIRGYLDVFAEELSEKMDPEQQQLLQRLVVSANRLSSYINNILNASRFDRRHLQIHLTEDSIKDIYDTISDDMRQRAFAQNRLLNVEFPDDLPTIAADRASLSEVMGNLIDNAVKYSNEGGAVNVTARAEGSFVVVSVEDHGIGIPGNVVANLFHKFYRSHRSRETVSGTGIGLYISKAVVDSHGGTISVKSAEGQGSTFEFTVPIYATVADKLAGVHNENSAVVTNGSGWIKNHAMYRG